MTSLEPKKIILNKKLTIFVKQITRMIEADLKQRILDLTHIEEVISEYVTLKRRGSNLLGLCPFHDEKSPSFTVTPAKGIFKCFGCGEGGDVISFVMKIDKLSYPDALKFLGKRMGLEIKDEPKTQTPEEELEYREKESLFVINQWAKNWFETQLKQNIGQQIGLSYLKERGINDESIVHFGLGFGTANQETLCEAALKAGHSLNRLINLGLAIAGNYGNPFDRFKDRVIFPFYSVSGRILGFGGRTLKNDKKEAKYLNSPESIIYKKSETLYGLFQAKKAIRKEDQTILVEGYLDVISLFQAGIEHVVASSGTSLTTEQARLLHRFSENVLLLYDGDAAGIKAALRGIDILLEQNLNVKVCLLPDGEDPDSFVKKQSGAILKDYIQLHSKYFIDFKADLLFDAAKNDPLQKVNAIKELADSLSCIADPLKRASFTTLLAQKKQIDEQLLVFEINKIRNKKLNKPQLSELEAPLLQHGPSAVISIKPLAGDMYQEKDIVRLLVLFGSFEIPQPDEDEIVTHTVADEIFSQLSDINIDHYLYKKVYDFVLSEHIAGKKVNRIQLLHHPDREISQLIAEIMANQPEISKNWEKKHDILVKPMEQNYVNDLISGLARFKLKRTVDKIKQLKLSLNNELNWENLQVKMNEIKELESQKMFLAQIIGSAIIE